VFNFDFRCSIILFIAASIGGVISMSNIENKSLIAIIIYTIAFIIIIVDILICLYLKRYIRIGKKRYLLWDFFKRPRVKLTLKGKDLISDDMKDINIVKSLIYLDVSYNLISNLSFIKQYKLEKLRILNLSHNKIIAIDELVYLKNLEELHLCSNEIYNIIPLSNLCKLSCLDVSRNPVRNLLDSIDNILENNPNLKDIRCSRTLNEYVTL